jgi:hypothetical protein
MKEKIQAGYRAYYSNLHLLKNKTISRKAKINIHKTLIRPVVIYGSEVWTLNKENEHAVHVFERKITRKIYGPIKINNEWKLEQMKK